MKKSPSMLLAALIYALGLVLIPGPTRANPADDPVVKAVAKASPAVVNISTVTIHQRRSMGNPFFDEFFKDFFDFSPRQSRRSESAGSGVIVDGQAGYVLTNNHVVAGATEVTVTLVDMREFPAKVVGLAPEADLAVLKIEAGKGLPTIELGDSDALMIGQRLIAIGNPFGLSHTVTTGVVSAKNRTFRVEGDLYYGFIQTDAAINPGNSGGALLDDSGRLVGINTAIYARAQGIGFAIPINRVRRIYRELVAHGRVRTGWLGLHIQTLTADLRSYFKVPGGRGVVVAGVEKDSPAGRAGLKAEDVIVAIDTLPVAGREAFFRAAGDYPPGQSLTVTFFRQGKKRTAELTPVVMPRAKLRDKALELLGFTVTPLNVATARRWRIEPGTGVVVESVRRGSEADRIGLAAGDVLLALNGRTIGSPQDFEDRVAALSPGGPIRVVVQRGNRRYRITLNSEG